MYPPRGNKNKCFVTDTFKKLYYLFNSTASNVLNITYQISFHTIKYYFVIQRNYCPQVYFTIFVMGLDLYFELDISCLKTVAIFSIADFWQWFATKVSQ